ncbi:thermonuclease family protein [Enterobacter cloacae complex sp. ECC445]|uniref:thermonuclease family protein n=1 Tax=Enterobacter cloacae complex sp. ECC445 TaxID=2913213 RepID=UPI003FA45BA2
MKMFPKLLFLSLLGTIPVAAFAAVESFEGKVVKVIDGDTVQILDNQNSNIRVRLYGIDAPESKQPWGQKAKQALSNAVAGKTVKVVEHGLDVYGRELGTIWLDGYDINASMVDSGLAWVYRFQDEAIVPAYIKFETGAKNASLGLWSEKSPVPPWEWRQINKKSEKQEKKTSRASL